MLTATEAIVLRSRKQGDTSKIVSLYTSGYGLVDVIAKGAREMKSKFGSSLEPFTCSKVSFYKKEGKDLYLLSGAETALPFRNLSSDLDHIEAATKVVELLLRSQHHEECHPDLYALIKETLSAMDGCHDGAAVWPVLFTYYVHYISFAGFQMNFGNDRSGSESAYYFDIEKGEVIELDRSSGIESDRLHMLSPEVLASLRHIARSGVTNAANLRLSAYTRHALDSLFRSYFNTHIEGMQHGRGKSGKVFSAMGK